MVYRSNTSFSNTLIKWAPLSSNGEREIMMSSGSEARRFGLNHSNGGLYQYGPNDPPQSSTMALTRRDATTGNEVVIVNGLSINLFRGTSRSMMRQTSPTLLTVIG
ncbi:MAG: hypothetical protein P1U82_24765 [Verrucomicrobiales bacterium]|jgi:hypothetical protein|nr:hypothetical protein [Verrucomicrobiales bacterium]MDF1789097.1 hypothetical protein [Verrucomicrobiales bacterium]